MGIPRVNIGLRILQVYYIYIYILIYTNIYILTAGSVAKASDTQAVGHGFEPRPDHN